MSEFRTDAATDGFVANIGPETETQWQARLDAWIARQGQRQDQQDAGTARTDAVDAHVSAYERNRQDGEKAHESSPTRYVAGQPRPTVTPDDLHRDDRPVQISHKPAPAPASAAYERNRREGLEAHKVGGPDRITAKP